jgi:hypothetical protein
MVLIQKKAPTTSPRITLIGLLDASSLEYSWVKTIDIAANLLIEWPTKVKKNCKL